MTRTSILEEITAERERQDALFGGPGHDDTHTATDWGAIIMRHLGLCFDDGKPADVCLMSDHCAGYDPVRYRRQLVRVAAVAVAALETFDRKVAQDAPLPAPGTDGDPRGTAGQGQLWAATPATPGTRMGPEEWAQRMADDLGVPVLLLDRRQRIDRSIESCTPYVIVADQADEWESQTSNHTRYLPRTSCDRTGVFGEWRSGGDAGVPARHAPAVRAPARG